jgi:putative salt-induced outer membrane protein
MVKHFWKVSLFISFIFISSTVGGGKSFSQDNVEAIDMLPNEITSVLEKAKNTTDQKIYMKAVTLLMDLYPQYRSLIADKAVSIFPVSSQKVRALETDLDILEEGFGVPQKNEKPNVGSFLEDHADFLTFKGWKGSAEMGFSSSSGDADAQAFTGGFRANRIFNISWEHAFKVDLNFAKANGISTQEKLTSDYQVYYMNWNRGYMFGLATFEYDKFSGFDYRLTQSVGVGYTIFNENDLRWSIEVGPGARESRTKLNNTEVEFVGTLNSNFRHWIQPEISYGTDIKTAWGPERFTIINIADLKARINDNFSARFSFETNYDSVVPLGTSKTDTLVKATIIYDFN